MGASSEVRETAEFKTLAEVAEQARITYQETMRGFVLSCAKLELNKLIGELQQIFLKGLFNICEMIVMQVKLKKNASISKWLLITSIKDKPEALKYSGFKEDGKEVTLNDIDEFLSIVFTKFYPNDNELPANKFALSTEQYGAVYQLLATAGDYLERVFDRSWKNQLGIYDAKDLQLELDKYALEQLDGAATKDTAEAIVVEPTVDSKTIDALIQDKITKEQKATKIYYHSFGTRFADLNQKTMVGGSGEGLVKKEIGQETGTAKVTIEEEEVGEDEFQKEARKTKGKSRRVKQRFVRRQRKARQAQLENQIEQEKAAFKNKRRQQEAQIRLGLQQCYGFVADPSKTKNHNTSIQFGKMPCWLYFHQPTNLACHNLCTSISPPPNFRALLGMSLNFRPQPSFTIADLKESFSRFPRDLSLRMFFTHKPQRLIVKKLHIKSDWTPPADKIPQELIDRMQCFFSRLSTKFKKKRSIPNLRFHRHHLLRSLKHHDDLMVVKTDKNLGPGVIERRSYVLNALSEHLLDKTTYRRLKEREARGRVIAITKIVHSFLYTWKSVLEPNAVRFIRQSLIVADPFPHFYLLFKIHKSPMRT